MAYTLTTSVSLGRDKTGLTLNAQLVDVDGVNSGAAITTGFSEIGQGFYLWKHTTFADGFRGGVKIYEQGVAGTILAFIAINPQEVENPDIKTSTAQDNIETAIDTHEINIETAISNSETVVTDAISTSETNIENKVEDSETDIKNKIDDLVDATQIMSVDALRDILTP